MKSIDIQLDNLWSKAITKKGYCEICGCLKEDRKLDPHHIISRNINILRWNLKNGVSLCRVCHSKYAHATKFKYKQEYNVWLENNIETNRINFLLSKRNAIADFTLDDKFKIMNILKKEVEKNDR